MSTQGQSKAGNVEDAQIPSLNPPEVHSTLAQQSLGWLPPAATTPHHRKTRVTYDSPKTLLLTGYR